jgi:hypothetical protein
MACNIPVAVTDIPGNREWLDEESGYFFAPGDVETLAGILASDAVGTAKASRALDIVHNRADWHRNKVELRGIAESITR